MPVKLPDGDIVSVRSEQAKRLLRLKIPLTITCSGCSPVAVNGKLCHESGCRDAWIDEDRACKNCGVDFDPAERESEFCCKSCYHDFNSIDDSSDD